MLMYTVFEHVFDTSAFLPLRPWGFGVHQDIPIHGREDDWAGRDGGEKIELPRGASCDCRGLALVAEGWLPSSGQLHGECVHVRSYVARSCWSHWCASPSWCCPGRTCGTRSWASCRSTPASSTRPPLCMAPCAARWDGEVDVVHRLHN